MADVIANIAKGRWREWVNISGGNDFGILLLKVAESDATLIDYDTIDALLGAAGNTESDATDYARKTGLTATDTTNDTDNRGEIDIPNQTWTGLGGASNNTIVKAVLFWEQSAADTGRIPIAYYDFSVTTSDTDVTINFDADGAVHAS